MAGAIALPEGRQGQILAAGIGLLGLALVWFAAVAPVLGFYQSRADTLAQQQAVAARMTALVREAPLLRAAVAAARPQSQVQLNLLAGGTDAVAGANLQSALQNLAQVAGSSLDSSEVLPAQQVGSLRLIGIQISLTATWPELIAFLQAIGTAQPRMIVGQLSIASASETAGADQPVQADFSVSAFSAGSP